MARIFISYSRADRQFIDGLTPLLRRVYGPDSVWFDDDIHGGVDWWQTILAQVADCELFVYLISNESLASPYCQSEYREALRLHKQVLPVIVRPKTDYPDPVPPDLAALLRRTQYVDMSRGVQDIDAITRLYASINRLLDEVPPKPPTPQSSQPISRPPVPDKPPEQVHLHVLDVLPPPFEWVVIPTGRVELKDHGAFDVAAFAIAKYPVTNAQFQVFVEAGGYREKQWWTASGWDAREQGIAWNSSENDIGPTGKPWEEPLYWRDDKWKGAECPVVGVSWYEAVAFCRWLSGQTGGAITLPTEQQWQRAAQGDDGREYPWGNEQPNERLCNFDNNVGQITPVTQYMDGASPYGVMDMVGNVWEWCLNEFENPKNTILSGGVWRVLRGGSWFYDEIFARVVYRDNVWPTLRDFDDGFRVACSLSL